jgi:hypothetical protein
VNPIEPRPSFWRRHVVQPVVAQLTQGVTPDRLALTFGVGLACGLFPFLGFTTALCFVAAAVLQLNQPVIHVVNQLLWPVQLALIAVYVRWGAALYGAPALPFDAAEVTRLFFASQREFWARFGLVGLHAFTAWLLTVPLVVPVVYFATRPLLRALAARLPPRSPAAADAQGNPVVARVAPEDVGVGEVKPTQADVPARPVA